MLIARSVARAINIVRDLGQFSKLGTADLEEVELRPIIEDAVTACAAELGPGERVTVLVDIGTQKDGQPLRLKAFPNLLGQVFVNLITNSAQAIEGPGRVKITARAHGADRVRIEVEDNGAGIPKENLTKIFEPFFTTKPPGKGTGLGLSICLGVVEKHGGTIDAVKRRRGAMFVIDLPLQPKLEPGDPRQSASIFSGGGTTVTLAR
jgi:two-component system, NtrC family, sensor kinase